MSARYENAVVNFGEVITTMHGATVYKMPSGLFRTDKDYYEYDTAIDAIKAHVLNQEIIASRKHTQELSMQQQALISKKSR